MSKRNKSKRGIDKAPFSESVRCLLLDWKAGASLEMCGSDDSYGWMLPLVTGDSFTLQFDPSLSSWQRRVVHNVAGSMDLYHDSYGDGEDRSVRVSREPLSPCPPSAPSCISKPSVEPQYFTLSESTRKEHLLTAETAVGASSPHVDRRIMSMCRDTPPDAHENLSNATGLDGSVCIVVDTLLSLRHMCTLLSSCDEIGFDMEMHSYRSYHGITCLLQLSCVYHPGRCSEDSWLLHKLPPTVSASREVEVDFLLDTLAVSWADIGRELTPIFGNPSIVKVCHGARSGDFPALYRDFGVVAVSVFDTQEACKVIGWTTLGLAPLLVSLCAPGVTPDQKGEDFIARKERLSTADWRKRPIPDDMLGYARLDVRFLIPLYRLLVRELYAMGLREVTEGDNVAGYDATLLGGDCDGSGMDEEKNNSLEVRCRSESGNWDRFSDTWKTHLSGDACDDMLPTTPAYSVAVDGDFPKGDDDLNCDSDSDNYEAMWEGWGVTAAGDSSSQSPSNDVYITPPELVYVKEVFCRTQSAASELWSPPPAYSPGDDIPSSLFRKIPAYRKRKKSKKWTAKHTHIFKRLIVWRDVLAREADESPAFVFPTALLLDTAANPPTSHEELLNLFNPLPDVLSASNNSKGRYTGSEGLLLVVKEALDEWNMMVPVEDTSAMACEAAVDCSKDIERAQLVPQPRDTSVSLSSENMELRRWVLGAASLFTLGATISFCTRNTPVESIRSFINVISSTLSRIRWAQR